MRLKGLIKVGRAAGDWKTYKLIRTDLYPNMAGWQWRCVFSFIFFAGGLGFVMCETVVSSLSRFILT